MHSCFETHRLFNSDQTESAQVLIQVCDTCGAYCANLIRMQSIQDSLMNSRLVDILSRFKSTIWEMVPIGTATTSTNWTWTPGSDMPSTSVPLTTTSEICAIDASTSQLPVNTPQTPAVAHASKNNQQEGCELRRYFTRLGQYYDPQMFAFETEPPSSPPPPNMGRLNQCLESIITYADEHKWWVTVLWVVLIWFSLLALVYGVQVAVHKFVQLGKCCRGPT